MPIYCAGLSQAGTASPRQGAGEGGDEAFFGVTEASHRARYTGSAPGAQWTGLTTALAEQALRAGLVDAVVTVAADPQDRWAPEATIVTEPAALAATRGMRMGYAPVVAAVERARDLGFKRLAVIALPCQSYALRSLELSLGLEALHLNFGIRQIRRYWNIQV